jgi:hypothetical protein
MSGSRIRRQREFADLPDRFFTGCVKTTGLVLDLVFVELDAERARTFRLPEHGRAYGDTMRYGKDRDPLFWSLVSICVVIDAAYHRLRSVDRYISCRN